MTSLTKVFVGGLLLVLVAGATIRLGFVIMLAMLIGAVFALFACNESIKRWETLGKPTPREQSFIDEVRRRAKKQHRFND